MANDIFTEEFSSRKNIPQKERQKIKLKNPHLTAISNSSNLVKGECHELN
jgi:hypothetical protein